MPGWAFLSWPGMSIASDLSRLTGDIFAGLGLDRTLGDVVVSSRPELGQFQCNGALAGAKSRRAEPAGHRRDRWPPSCRTDSRLAEVSVAGPGFVNLTVTDAYLAAVLDRSDGRFGARTRRTAHRRRRLRRPQRRQGHARRPHPGDDHRRRRRPALRLRRPPGHP